MYTVNWLCSCVMCDVLPCVVLLCIVQMCATLICSVFMCGVLMCIALMCNTVHMNAINTNSMHITTNVYRRSSGNMFKAIAACWPKPAYVHSLHVDRSKLSHCILTVLGWGESTVLPSFRPPAWPVLADRLDRFACSLVRGASEVRTDTATSVDLDPPLADVLSNMVSKKVKHYALPFCFVDTIAKNDLAFQSLASRIRSKLWVRMWKHLQCKQKSMLNTRCSRKRDVVLLARAAFSRLRGLPELIDVPTDKNIGTVIMQRRFYFSSIVKEVGRNFSAVSRPHVEVLLRTWLARCRSWLAVCKQQYFIPESVLSYVMSNFDEYKFPRLRALVKIHKNCNGVQPDAVPMRVLVIGTKWISTPAAQCVGHLLEVVVKAIPTVCRSTHSFLESLQSLGSEAFQNAAVSTFDVEKLFQTIPSAAILPCVTRALDIHFAMFRYDNAALFAQLILDLSSFVLALQIVHMHDRFYVQNSGIMTGLACDCQWANIFMAEADCYTREAMLGHCRFFLLVSSMMCSSFILIPFRLWPLRI